MSMAEENGLTTLGPVVIQQTSSDDSQYECRIAIIPEEEGGYSIIATQLPGVASHGETIEEAIENIKEAFQGAAEIYLEEEGKIPWSESKELPHGNFEQRWIAINVKTTSD